VSQDEYTETSTNAVPYVINIEQESRNHKIHGCVHDSISAASWNKIILIVWDVIVSKALMVARFDLNMNKYNSY
jgi:hypothetical protein